MKSAKSRRRPVKHKSVNIEQKHVEALLKDFRKKQGYNTKNVDELVRYFKISCSR